MKKPTLFIFLHLLLFAGGVWAMPIQNGLKLADLFGEGMVLQQNNKNNFWGEALPSSLVRIEMQGKKAEIKAGEDGRWKTSLKGLKAGGPFVLKVTSNNQSIVLSDVYVGEVWLASGQSNMERRLSMSENGEQVAAAATNTNIRFTIIPKINYEGESVDRQIKWQAATYPQVSAMSAVGYYFAVQLQQKLNVPIGIICCYKGGIPAEAFLSEETLLSNDKTSPIVERFRETAIYDDEQYNKAMNEYKERFKLYNDSVAMGYRQLSRPFEPIGTKHHKRPGGLYHTMLKRIVPYSIKGVIWYQGEGNAERGEQYKTLFPALIKEWRKDFGQPDLPFYFVQLTNFDHPFWQNNPYWAEIREAQLHTWQTVKNTAMVVSIDKGDKNDLHPIYKRPIGERLAACALNLVYGTKQAYSGPIYKSMNIKGNEIELNFDFVYSGLSSGGDTLSGFTICGSDYRFVPAKAKIIDNKVVVWADGINHPRAVRYGWANWSDGNLFNKEGFPASPFRTDHLPMLSDGVYYPMRIR